MEIALWSFTPYQNQFRMKTYKFKQWIFDIARLLIDIYEFFYRIATTVLLMIEVTRKTNLKTENVQKTKRWNDGMKLLGAKKK